MGNESSRRLRLTAGAGVPWCKSPALGRDVALTAVDRALLHRCLHHDPGAWNDFVDRFLGLIYHVVHHTAYLRSTPLPPEDIEDVAAEILLQIVANDYAILRQFRGQSSLATYLTVIARRICVHELARRAAAREMQPKADGRAEETEAEEPAKTEAGWSDSRKCKNSSTSCRRANVRSSASATSKAGAMRRSAPSCTFPSTTSVRFSLERRNGCAKGVKKPPPVRTTGPQAQNPGA